MRLCPLIPHTQIEHHTRKQSAFRDAQKEPRDNEACEVLCYAEESGDDAPGEHEGWEPEAGRGALEDDVAGDFEEDLCERMEWLDLGFEE